MSAILFGSISTVADTSELQREAFNQAFEAHGLGWRWDRDEYATMLEGSGGQDRIASYAASRGESVDAAAVHETKTALFQKSLAGSGVVPRPGVVDTIRAATEKGLKLGLVTTTSPGNVAALLEALAPAVQVGVFDVIVDVTDVDRPKPDGAAYVFALESLGEDAAACVAVEDNIDGVRAAAAAGIRAVAFPNQNTAAGDFGPVRRVDRLDADQLSAWTAGGDLPVPA